MAFAIRFCRSVPLLQNTGPLQNDLTQILNIAATTKLPRQFELGLNFSYSSAPPFSAYIGGIDLNGDGTQGDLLPGDIGTYVGTCRSAPKQTRPG